MMCKCNKCNNTTCINNNNNNNKEIKTVSQYKAIDGGHKVLLKSIGHDKSLSEFLYWAKDEIDWMIKLMG